jgi:hypothetical protein
MRVFKFQHEDGGKIKEIFARDEYEAWEKLYSLVERVDDWKLIN